MRRMIVIACAAAAVAITGDVDRSVPSGPVRLAADEADLGTAQEGWRWPAPRRGADGHADYPHEPGTLPGCPRCDAMEGEQ